MRKILSLSVFAFLGLSLSAYGAKVGRVLTAEQVKCLVAFEATDSEIDQILAVGPADDKNEKIDANSKDNVENSELFKACFKPGGGVGSGTY